MFNLLLRFLGVTMGMGEVDANVTDVELQFAVDAGISWRLSNAGMVSYYEEHNARLQANIALEKWETMDYMDKALTVATLRVRNAIHNQQAEAEIRESRRKTHATGK